jgi:hypothetical protein
MASTAGSAAGKAAAPAIADEIDVLDRPETQKKIIAVAESPAAQTAARDLSKSAAEGAAEEFAAIVTGNPATQPGDTTQAAALRAEFQDLIHKDVTPALNEVIHSAIEQVMQDLASRDVQIQASKLGEAIADGAVRGSIPAFTETGSPALAEMIRAQIAPAIGDAVRQQLVQTLNEQSKDSFMQTVHRLFHQELMPAVHELWDLGTSDTLLLPTRPDLAPAVRANAQNLAEGTTTGTHEALIQLGVLSSTGGLAGPAKAIAWAAGIAAVLIGLAALALLVVLCMIAIALWRRPIGVK